MIRLNDTDSPPSNMSMFGVLWALIVSCNLLAISAVAQSPTPSRDPPKDPVIMALAPQPGGLTIEDIIRRVGSTDPEMHARRAEVLAAEARLTQALAAYFPRLSLGAKYARVSPVDAFEIPALPPAAGDGAGGSLAFPVLLNQYSLSASLGVPLSDYLFRLTQAYAAVSLDADGKRLLLRARKDQAALAATLAYLSWIRQKGRVAIAEAANTRAMAHVGQARVSFDAGVVAKADVQRLVARGAQAAHLLAAAKALVAVTEDRLRTILRFERHDPLRIGVDVLNTKKQDAIVALHTLKAQALRQRPELAAFAKTQASLKQAESVLRAGYAPRIDAFATAVYANPNPRVFPQQERWDFSWEFGAQVTFVINDTFATLGVVREQQARRDSVKYRAMALRDAIGVAVASAYYELLTARSSLEAVVLREQSARLSLDARLMLFRAGRATAVDLIDAESELTTARLQHVDARIDALAARAKLDHAVGADHDAVAIASPNIAKK